jgi:hypothetical protein
MKYGPLLVVPALSWGLTSRAAEGTTCGLSRAQTVFTGCGYTYILQRERDIQCGTGGTSEIIVDSYNGGSSCGVERAQTVYTGCGFTYMSKQDRDTQCGDGGTSKIIFDSWTDPTKVEGAPSAEPNRIGKCSVQSETITFLDGAEVEQHLRIHLNTLCAAYALWLKEATSEPIKMQKTAREKRAGTDTNGLAVATGYLTALNTLGIVIVE